MANEPTISITHVCGHKDSVVARCAQAYSQRLCNECAALHLPKPSECLRRFIAEKGNNFGPMLGPIGAVIYARQSWFGYSGITAWSGTDGLHDALEGFNPTREVQPYVELFAAKGY